MYVIYLPDGTVYDVAATEDEMIQKQLKAAEEVH